MGGGGEGARTLADFRTNSINNRITDYANCWRPNGFSMAFSTGFLPGFYRVLTGFFKASVGTNPVIRPSVTMEMSRTEKKSVERGKRAIQ